MCSFYRIKCAICLLVLWAGLCRCRKFVDVPPPATQVSSSSVFADDGMATSAMTGLYGKMMGAPGLFNSHLTLFAGLAADELQRSVPLSLYTVFQTNDIPSSNSTVSSVWSTAYNTIYQANAILEGVAASGQLSAAVRKQLTGEALFVRAMTYFYLVNLFGDVPLALTTSYDTNAFLPRTRGATVYAQVVNDLQNAADLLPERYETAAGYPLARVRPNKWAVTALLARVLLYQKEYAGAERLATALIGSGLYALEPNLNDVFLAGSREAVWQLMPVSQQQNTAEGAVLLPFSATVIPGFVLSPTLLNSFAPEDGRKGAWTKTQTVNGKAYTYPYKYKVLSGGAPYAEYNMVLRLSEQYLVRAEARAHQGDISGALSDLNTVRLRAGLPALADTLSQAAVLAAVEKENFLEFFAEWGHRWLDLKRTGRANAVLSAVKGASWQPTDVLWPIPFSQLQLNYQLEQNPGY